MALMDDFISVLTHAKGHQRLKSLGEVLECLSYESSDLIVQLIERHRNQEFVELINSNPYLVNGYDYHITNFRDEFRSLLIIALEHGNKIAIDSLLNNGAHVNHADWDGITPIMYAARKNNIGAFKRLKSNGADLDAADYQGNSVLMYAARYADPDIVRLILAQQSDVERKNKNHETAIDIIAGNPDKAEILALLIDKAPLRRHGEALLDAAKNGAIENVKVLLDVGIDPSVTDDLGGNALFLAAKNNHADLVIELLSRGFQIDAEDHSGKTAMDVAKELGAVDSIKAMAMFIENRNLTAKISLSDTEFNDLGF